MKLIVERWVRQVDEAGEEIETIAESIEVASEAEAKEKAREWKKLSDTSRVTLHYCRHDESPPKPCRRVEL